MTYYAINGSPRKTHNTATILNKALEGVKAADPQAQTELIHLRLARLFPQHYRQDAYVLRKALFQYFVYDADYSALSPKRMPTAFVYTMNVPYQVMLENHYTESFQSMESFIQRVFSKPETLYVNDTYQFSDYSKYKADRFSETDKARHREQQFPIDCQKAFELGKALVKRNG